MPPEKDYYDNLSGLPFFCAEVRSGEISDRK
jgi:hypothetical protein